MIKHKVIYCEIEFLQSFLQSFPVINFDIESLKKIETWISFYQFICKSHIILNISKDEFVNLTNENQWFKLLWKNSTGNSEKLDFEKEAFPNIESLDGTNTNEDILNSIFLTTKDNEVCYKKSIDLGVFIFNLEMINNCDILLFKDNGTEFPTENANKWLFLNGLTKPNAIPAINISNSMIIIDNYLLCDDINGLDYQEKLKYNLRPILSILLPEKLPIGESYHITFFVGAKQSYQSHLYDKQYNYILNLISEIRSKLDFKLSIFIGKDAKFHDRSILTNNVIINSGYGFGILDKKGITKTPTSVNIVFPFIQTKINWCDGSYLNILKTAYKICSRLPEPNINCWGEYKELNRLIKYYNKNEKTNENSTSKNPIYTPQMNALNKIDLSQLQKYSRNRTPI